MPRVAPLRKLQEGITLAMHMDKVKKYMCFISSSFDNFEFNFQKKKKSSLVTCGIINVHRTRAMARSHCSIGSLCQHRRREMGPQHTKDQRSFGAYRLFDVFLSTAVESHSLSCQYHAQSSAVFGAFCRCF